MTQAASTAQIRRIHTLARLARLGEDDRRNLMERETGHRSTKSLSITQAIKVIDALQQLPGAGPAAAPKAKGALKLDGPYVAKIRALWISGFHLGLVRDRSDTAMVAFVERQTRIQNTRWLRDPADARKVIEALKSWLGRGPNGVQWTEEEPGAEGAKRAVYLAIRRLLTLNGVDPHFAEFPGKRFLASDKRSIDALTAAAGERLRQARAEAGGS